MKINLFLFFLFLLLPVKTYAQTPDTFRIITPPPQQTELPYAENRIIVQYKKGQSKQDLQNTVNLRKIQAQTALGRITQRTSDIVTKLTGKSLPEEKLAKINGVEQKYSLTEKKLTITSDQEQIVVVQNTLGKTIDVTEAVSDFINLAEVENAVADYKRQPFFIPNDTYYSYQWALSIIQAPQAWDITQGDTLGNVLIAIIDTGIANNHSDLLSSKVVSYYNCANISGCSIGGDDIDGHGTHVAGIAAALTNNATGVSGVGFNTKLISLKVDDIDGFIYDSYVINALDKLITDFPGKKLVINLSLGGPFSDVILENAINRAWNAGFVIVAASGNCGNNTDPTNTNCNGQTNPIMYPAYYLNVIAVAASTNSPEQKASYSEYGTWVDIAAPGGEGCTTSAELSTICILSTYPPIDYGGLAGTSMASPHVAGVAALVWSANSSFTNLQVRQKMEQTADSIAGTGTYWTNGRVNAFRAVQSITPTSTITPSPTPSCPLKTQGDANCDNQVDIIDFNGWWLEATGQQTTKSADFNNDSIVNIIDFNRWWLTATGQ